jgi:hypothetical protein
MENMLISKSICVKQMVRPDWSVFDTFLKKRKKKSYKTLIFSILPRLSSSFFTFFFLINQKYECHLSFAEQDTIL